MAYVDQETIDFVRDELKKLNKEFGMKTSVAGKGSSSLEITIISGPLDFKSQVESHRDPRYYGTPLFTPGQGFNRYWDLVEYNPVYTGKEAEYLKRVTEIATAKHWDESDIMTDYFSCAYYINIKFGKWNKAYVCTKESTSA